ncbi:MAG: hypothetical protein IT271_12470 [Chitinophagales bacterium]|nr:hypothetical protein [Chitinophagales bacterium]
MQNAQTHNDIVLELVARREARKNFLLFIKYTKPDFEINWHHALLAQKLQLFAEGKIKKLMVYLPPQVGKSEMSTRRLPSYVLGKNPDKRIAICAYNQTFASQFNRDIQRIIMDPTYSNVFPGTKLNEKNSKTEGLGNFLRNSEMFEVVGYRGRVKSVGVGGALTGTSVDMGIIDDPIKDAKEAFSGVFRDRLWDWYISVFKTRLHNKSQQLITLTRWHEDDLAGRILKSEPDWEIVTLPAVREDLINDYDPRQIGEAIWPSRHSLERYEEIKRLNPLIYVSLYQQRPYFTKDQSRWAYAFDEQKHVGKCEVNYEHPIWLVFDFNKNPICCSIIQHYDDTIWIPRSFKLPNSDIYKLCDVIWATYGVNNPLFLVTGDATGKNSSALVMDNKNYYTIIKQKLGLSAGQMRQPLSNPKLEENQVLVNALLANYQWVIDEENASAVIFDMQYVKMLPDGTIDKGDRSDPTKQADALDTVRYFCNTEMSWFIKIFT